MYIQVQLLTGYGQPLWYKVPEGWPTNSFIGTFVRVPLRKSFVSALVIKQNYNPPSESFIIRDAHSIEAFPDDDHYHTFIKALSAYYQINPLILIKRIGHFIRQPQIENVPVQTDGTTQPSNTITHLTDEQQKAVECVEPYLSNTRYFTLLLHGVTGSGKTEVYKELIKKTIALEKTALLLFPEVTLALAFEQRLKKELPDIEIYGFHSATSPKDKKKVWQSLIDKKPCLILGVHMPILLPIAGLGLIIIDEEHEVGYQEKKHPKIHTKEAALLRAKINNIPIILGSATPSIHALHMVNSGHWHFFQLKKRFAGLFPHVELIMLPEERTKRKHFWISQQLQEALQEQLDKKEQTILFLNRRGYSFFVQCRTCSFIAMCSNCSVSLTLHDQQQLTCHYCGYITHAPTTCPSCKAPEKELLKKGIGTQQVVSILQELFPTARVARADLDITSKKKLWHKTINDMQQGNIDILVGTQSITKGLDFSNVTLVGIIWADLNLHMPLFNAAETTLQQLIQVAGRAGRHGKESRVIIQAMGEHEIFAYMHEQDYLQFYQNEITLRTATSYPPAKRLIEIELKYHEEEILRKEAESIALIFRHHPQLSDVIILGPVQPLVYKIKNSFSYKIYLKTSRIDNAITLFKSVDKKSYRSSIFFTPNPTR